MRAREFHADELKLLLEHFAALGGHGLCVCAMLVLLVALGARVSEICELRRADIIDAAGRPLARIRRRQLKTGAREKFISREFQPNAVEIVLRWLDFQKLNYGARRTDYAFAISPALRKPNRLYFYQRLKRACAAVGIDPRGISMHSGRKTYAMNQFRAWKNKTGSTMQAAAKVQALLGHRDINTTLAYLGISDDDPQMLSSEINRFLEITNAVNFNFSTHERE